jgi:dTDP-4-dehydrorhamnose reductase
MSDTPILVLGGTGFVGRHLVRHLGTLGQLRVHAPGREELDVTDESQMVASLESYRPAVVFNCAASTGIGSLELQQHASERLNIETPSQWAAACHQQGARLIHLSTDQVFPGDATKPYREEDTAAPISTYGKTKLAGENAVLSIGSHLVVRTSFVFGAGGNTFMSRLPLLLSQNAQLKVVMGIRASCVHINTLVGALGALATEAACGILHIANRGETSWELFAEQCAQEMQRRDIPVRCPELVRIEYSMMRETLGPRALYSVLDIGKYERTQRRLLPTWQKEIPRFIDACFPDQSADTPRDITDPVSELTLSRLGFGTTAPKDAPSAQPHE